MARSGRRSGHLALGGLAQRMNAEFVIGQGRWALRSATAASDAGSVEGVVTVNDLETRPIEEQLHLWVSEGLLAPEVAERIEDFEAHRAAPAAQKAPSAPARRIPLVVEALGYLGGIMALVAGAIAVQQLWPDITSTGAAVFAAAATVVLLAGGWLVPAPADPAFGRLRSVLWALSCGTFGAALALFGVDRWDLTGEQEALAVFAAVGVLAVGLWLLHREILQHLVMFAAVVAVAGLTTFVVLDDSLQPWSAGLAVWVLSAAWGAVVLRTHLLEPRVAGLLASAVGLLVGAMMTMTTAAGNVLALATVGVVITGGVALRKVWLVGIGALGALEIVPVVAIRYLPRSVAAPLSIFALGMVILGIAIWLTRRHRLQA